MHASPSDLNRLKSCNLRLTTKRGPLSPPSRRHLSWRERDTHLHFPRLKEDEAAIKRTENPFVDPR